MKKGCFRGRKVSLKKATDPCEEQQHAVVPEETILETIDADKSYHAFISTFATYVNV